MSRSFDFIFNTTKLKIISAAFLPISYVGWVIVVIERFRSPVVFKLKKQISLLSSAFIEEGHKSTLLPQLGNIAFPVGRALKCKPDNGHILNDKEAMKLWDRKYEKGWEVKV